MNQKVGRRCPHRAAHVLQRSSHQIESQPGALRTDAPYLAPGRMPARREKRRFMGSIRVPLLELFPVHEKEFAPPARWYQPLATSLRHRGRRMQPILPE